MAKTSKPKKRENKYQEKLNVNVSFDDLMDVLFPIPEKKKEKKPVAKKAVKKKK